MSKIKSSLALAIAAFLAISAAACAGSPEATPTQKPAAQQPAAAATPAAPQAQPPAQSGTKELVIAGSQSTGTWFVFSGALAQVISKHIPGYKASPTPSDGSALNIQNLKSGTIDLGMSLPDVLYAAYNGTGIFQDKKVPEIRALYNTYSFPLHIITRDDTNINQVTDLKGKKIAIGPPGSTDHVSFLAVLAEYGMDIKDMESRPLSLNDRITALVDKQVDAIVVLTGTASAAVTELMTTKDAHYIDVPPDVLKKINEKHPYFVEGTIPKETYSKLKKDVSTVFTWGVMCVIDKMDEKLAYDITKATFEYKDEIVQILDLAKELNPENAVKVPVPLHPGAEKYFKEVGVLK